jgi:hypothetical protein
MHRYKTVVTDYEGMQGTLDTHASQGWRLFSLTPDTWRKMSGAGRGMEPPPFDDLDTQPTQEYSASYYLLVFVSEDLLDEPDRLSTLQEPFPVSQGIDFGD